MHFENRRQFRADWHDYSEGIYFVTICCSEKRHYFGEIADGKMNLTNIGYIVKESIEDIRRHFAEVDVWNSVVMPNHVHLVIAVGTRHGASASHPTDSNTKNRGCLKPKRHYPVIEQDFHHNSRLAVVINQLKSTVKRETNKRNIPFAWQQRFHEHIIRSHSAYDNIMNYIDNNIASWCYDKFNKNRIDDADAPWRVPTTKS